MGKLWELVMDREASCAAVHGVGVGRDWATELNFFNPPEGDKPKENVQKVFRSKAAHSKTSIMLR